MHLGLCLLKNDLYLMVYTTSSLKIIGCAFHYFHAPCAHESDMLSPVFLQILLINCRNSWLYVSIAFLILGIRSCTINMIKPYDTCLHTLLNKNTKLSSCTRWTLRCVGFFNNFVVQRVNTFCEGEYLKKYACGNSIWSMVHAYIHPYDAYMLIICHSHATNFCCLSGVNTG